MSTGSLGLVMAALFALGAAWFTGKTLGTRAAADAPAAPVAARRTPFAARERIDLRQSLLAHAAAMAQRGIDVELSMPDTPLPVSALAGELPLLMAHIADAAVEALPLGTTLRVLVRAEGPQAVVSLRETDTSSEVVPRLSRAFETGTASGVAPHVHACQAIAARHGARIYTATSPLGGGCLTLRFPMDGTRTVRTPKGLL